MAYEMRISDWSSDVCSSDPRVWAIVAGSSGNLVEWYDFYVYSFCALYFAPAFFPQGNTTTQLLSAAGVFAAGFLMRPIGGWFFGRFADRQGRRAAMVLPVLSAEARPVGKEGVSTCRSRWTSIS